MQAYDLLRQGCLSMRVHQELPPQLPSKDTILAIGVFDGIHIGHQHLLNSLKEAASKADMLSGVLTFSNHPRTVLAPDSEVHFITSVQDRLTFLESSGLDIVIPMTFDLELSRLRAQEFTELLQARLRMKGLVMGQNFAMGFRREGTPDMLRSLGSEKGFSVTVVDPFLVNGDRVSSTDTRAAISTGDIQKAHRNLGRPFVLQGKVVAGNARGKSLGFPTANLSIDKDRILPADGIYATWANIGSKRFMAATNVGLRPTFDGTERVVESFIIDLNENLYNLEISLAFIERLRDEQKFQRVEDLVTQMGIDVEQTREILNRNT